MPMCVLPVIDARAFRCDVLEIRSGPAKFQIWVVAVRFEPGFEENSAPALS